MQYKQSPISKRQQDILSYIRLYYEERGYPPSIREIVGGCGISSTSVAAYHLKQLEVKGYLRRHPDISRGLELAATNQPDEISVPLAGSIAAGAPLPVLSADTWEAISALEFINIPRKLVNGHENVFALKVKGDSMQDALIEDGDVILMSPVNSVEDGETAAVWIKDTKEITLKKVYRDKDMVRLQPANKHYKPLTTHPFNIEVQGKVIAVLRNL